MKKIGRKTKLSPEVQERICKSVRLGNTYECAAEAGGISKPTLFDWINRGMDGEEPFANFYNSIKKARAEAEEYAVEIVRNAMLTTWTAAAWWLERTNPEKYGKRIQQEVSNTKGDVFKIEYVKAKHKKS